MQLPQLHISFAKLLRYTLLIVVVAVSFLFSPAPKSEKDYCGQYIHLGQHAGLMFNCDAADYCMTSKIPSRLIADSATRQSRPLYILAGTVLGYPLQWLVEKVDLPFFHSMGEEAAMYIGFYAGYILLNYILILLSLLLFDAIIEHIRGRGVNKWILLAFHILLVSNEVTKAFFWTAHQQFFTLFTPLLTIYLYLRISSGNRTLNQIGGVSLVSGLLMLVYGNFLPMFCCVLWAAYRVDRKMHIPHTLKNALLFLLPTIVWMSICIMKNGHYYNHEMERYRQLVWIKDTLSVSLSEFLSVFANYLRLFAASFKEITFFIFIALVLSWYALSKKDGDLKRALPAICSVFIIYMVFYMILGYYQTRLTFTLFPICLICIFLAISGSKGLYKNAMVYIALAIGWHLYNLLSYGPFS